MDTSNNMVNRSMKLTPRAYDLDVSWENRVRADIAYRDNNPYTLHLTRKLQHQFEQPLQWIYSLVRGSGNDFS